MELSRRAALQAGAATAAAWLAGGCRSDSGGPRRPAGPPRRGGTLRIGAFGRAASVVRDPHGTQTNESDYLVLSLLYDTLTAPGPGGVAPRLASRWTASPDLRSWRLELAEGARFHDGSPVTSADVVFSLRRLRQSAIGRSRLPGIEVDGIRADGPRSVVVESAYPNSDLPVVLRLTTFVVKDGTTDPAGAPGTGPFRLEWFRDGNARLVRNDDWYLGPPLLDAVEVQMFEQPEAMLNAVLTGQIDLASNVGPTAGRAGEGRSGLQVLRRPDDMALPVVMRTSDGPFADPRVREAFRLTPDRRGMVEQALSGYGAVGNDILGTADPLYARDLPQRGQDLRRADRLLTAAGFDRGRSYPLVTSDDVPGLAESATLFAHEMRKVGVQLEVVKQDSSTFLGQSKGKAPLYTSYWGTNDSLTFSATKLLLSTASSNEADWRDPEFDAAYRDAVSTADPARHREALRRMQQIEHDRSGYLLWGTADGVDVARDTVQDLPTLPGYGRVQLERTWLSG